MARQNIDYTTSTLTPPHAPVNDDLDTGTTTDDAVRPIVDGEPAQGAVFKRPSENLRTRTEIIREELEQLKFMSDADKAMLLTSTGDITWNGLPTGTFVPTQNLVLKPFLAPDTSTMAKLVICANTPAEITIRTKVTGVSGQPRAYNGANNITIDLRPQTVGDGSIAITTTGDGNRIHIRYDDHAVSGTTAGLNALTGFIQQFNADPTMIAMGLEAVSFGTGTPAEGTQRAPPGPPSFVANSLIKDHIVGVYPAGEHATRFLSGAAEAEQHIITPGSLSSFFIADGGTLNKLIEGDVLCIWYDEMVGLAYGGRRQSLNEAPENSATIPVGSLFLLRRFPERLPGALPVATVVNGQLIFINGRVYGAGETGPLVASGSSYQGSPAAPNSWADSTVVAGPVSFESALDTIIQTLGVKSGGTPGAIKVGFTPAGDIATNNVKAALEELDSKKASRALPQNNTFTNANVFTPSTAATTAVTATGNTTGRGVTATGGASAATGVYGKGGTGNGIGVEGFGGTGGNGVGVWGTGTGGAAGVQGDGGPSAGAGVYGAGGTNGIGVWGAGDGLGKGVLGEGSPGSASTANTAPSTGNPLVQAAGVVGLGHSSDGYGVVGKGNGGDGGGVAGVGVGGAGPGVLGVVEGDAAPVTSGEGVVGQSGAGGVLGIGLGNGFGVKGSGAGTGKGGTFTGGATGPSSFATTMDGAGVEARGGAAGNANGVHGKGGSAATPGARTEIFANNGVVGVGTGGGAGVIGVSSATTLTAGVEGFGSTGGGLDTYGVKGTGVGSADGVRGLGGTAGGAGVSGQGQGSLGVGVLGAAGTNGVGGDFTGNGTGVGVKVRSQDRWDLTNTDGDILLVGGGSNQHKLKIGMATGGGGAGSCSIAVQSTVLNQLSLGAGTTTADQSVLRLNSGELVGVGVAASNAQLEVNKGIHLGTGLRSSAANARTVPRISAVAATTATSDLTLISKYTNPQNGIIYRQYISSVGELVSSVNVDLTSYAGGIVDVTGPAFSSRMTGALQEWWSSSTDTGGGAFNPDFFPSSVGRGPITGSGVRGRIGAYSFAVYGSGSGGDNTTSSNVIHSGNTIKAQARVVVYGDVTTPFFDSTHNVASVAQVGNGVRINFTSTVYAQNLCIATYNSIGGVVPVGGLIVNPVASTARVDIYAVNSAGTIINMNAGGQAREFFFISMGF